MRRSLAVFALGLLASCEKTRPPTPTPTPVRVDDAGPPPSPPDGKETSCHLARVDLGETSATGVAGTVVHFGVSGLGSIDNQVGPVTDGVDADLDAATLVYHPSQMLGAGKSTTSALTPDQVTELRALAAATLAAPCPDGPDATDVIYSLVVASGDAAMRIQDSDTRPPAGSPAYVLVTRLYHLADPKTFP